jgi:hypothetical protein
MEKKWKKYDYKAVNLPQDILTKADEHLKKLKDEGFYSNRKSRAEFVKDAILLKIGFDSKFVGFEKRGYKFGEEEQSSLEAKLIMTLTTLDELLRNLKTTKEKKKK